MKCDFHVIYSHFEHWTQRFTLYFHNTFNGIIDLWMSITNDMLTKKSQNQRFTLTSLQFILTSKLNSLSILILTETLNDILENCDWQNYNAYFNRNQLIKLAKKGFHFNAFATNLFMKDIFSFSFKIVQNYVAVVVKRE